MRGSYKKLAARYPLSEMEDQMRLGLTVIIAAYAASPVAAQQASAYKLIVGTSEGGGIAVIDYPSAARCERARAALEADMQRRTDQANARLAPGAIITSYGWRAYAACIPA